MKEDISRKLVVVDAEKEKPHIYNPLLSEALLKHTRLGEVLGGFRLRIVHGESPGEKGHVYYGDVLPTSEISLRHMGPEQSKHLKTTALPFEPLVGKGILRGIREYVLEPLIECEMGHYTISPPEDEAITKTMRKIYAKQGIDPDRFAKGDYTVYEFYEKVLGGSHGKN